VAMGMETSRRPWTEGNDGISQWPLPRPIAKRCLDKSC